jgi:hypothetical protein
MKKQPRYFRHYLKTNAGITAITQDQREECFAAREDLSRLRPKDDNSDKSAKLNESKSSKKLVQIFLSALSSLLKKPLYSTGR